MISGGERRRNTRRVAIPNKNPSRKNLAVAGAAARSEREAVGSSEIGAADQQPKIGLFIQLGENKQTNQEKRKKKRLVRKAEEICCRPVAAETNRAQAGKGSKLFPLSKLKQRSAQA